MNRNEFEGKWKQIRGQARQWWGKLTDDDLERVGGKLELLVSALQEKYGYTHEVAAEECSRRLAQYATVRKPQRSGGQAPIPDIGEAQWKQMYTQIRGWWGRLPDADLDKAAGKAEAVFALLQAEYGMSRERAEAEFKRRVIEYEISLQEKPVPVTYFI